MPWDWHLARRGVMFTHSIEERENGTEEGEMQKENNQKGAWQKKEKAPLAENGLEKI